MTFSGADQPRCFKSIWHVDPMPNRLIELDMLATSVSRGARSILAAFASAQISCSVNKASRLSRPWSWIEKRISRLRNPSTLAGTLERVAAQAKEVCSTNSFRIVVIAFDRYLEEHHR